MQRQARTNRRRANEKCQLRKKEGGGRRSRREERCGEGGNGTEAERGLWRAWAAPPRDRRGAGQLLSESTWRRHFPSWSLW